MMSIKIGVRSVRRALTALLGAALLSAAVPLAASAACPAALTENSFEQFGDHASYSLAPGGAFESGAPGWALSKSSVVDGNESFNVVAGSHSLATVPFGSAASPWICIGSEYPSFRFFARRTGGSSDASLVASLRWVNALGLSVESGAGSVSNGGSWAPSPVMKLGNSLPLWLPGSTLDVRLVFRATGDAPWAIDDVFIDPYRR
jgi:hypothetical protein